VSIPRGGLWALCFAVAGTAPGLVDATTKEISMTLQVGDTAPDFTAATDGSQPLTLSTFLATNGKGKTVVLYFYPKDDTYNCIVESSEFRDQYEVYKNVGAEVIGVSSDSPQSHVKFAEKYKLPFVLLSDQTNEVRESYGVSATLGFIPGRVTFVIDKTGVVRHVFNSQFNPKSHVSQSLSILKDLTKP
jgi:peroxiredoxin Q/BCP